MKKISAILVLIANIGFAQEVVIKKNLQMELNPDPEKVTGYNVIDFCVKGLLYRGFEALGSYMTSKIVMDPASFRQVIGSDGKPMTCKVEEQKK